jgi:hypothetical protein
MKGMQRWLQRYERERHSKRPKEPNESWVSSKYDLGIHWAELQQTFVPELNMTFGSAISVLKKSWKSYKIAGREGMNRSDLAYRIVSIQNALGLPKSDFPELENMSFDQEFREAWSNENEGQDRDFEQEPLTQEEIQLRREEESERREWVDNQVSEICGSEYVSEPEGLPPEWSRLGRRECSRIFRQLDGGSF